MRISEPLSPHHFGVRGLAAIGALLILTAFGCGGPDPIRTGGDTSALEFSARVPSQCGGTSQSPCSISGSRHVALGVPTDQNSSDDYLMGKADYVLSYNPTTDGANWVGWRLRDGDFGAATRSNNFEPDDSLPENFYRVTTRDYRHSGYDRGHMCPSGERTRTEEDNASTFLMTNILPQSHELNIGPWKQLEDREQEIVRSSGHEMQVIAGPVFTDQPATIGPGVAVPAANFRIVVELEPGQGPDSITVDTPVYAVIMPNESSVAGHDWQDFVVTVDQIEAATGYDFLTAVPKEIQDVIEARPGNPSAN